MACERKDGAVGTTPYSLTPDGGKVTPVRTLLTPEKRVLARTLVVQTERISLSYQRDWDTATRQGGRVSQELLGCSRDAINPVLPRVQASRSISTEPPGEREPCGRMVLPRPTGSGAQAPQPNLRGLATSATPAFSLLLGLRLTLFISL